MGRSCVSNAALSCPSSSCSISSSSSAAPNGFLGLLLSPIAGSLLPPAKLSNFLPSALRAPNPLPPPPKDAKPDVPRLVVVAAIAANGDLGNAELELAFSAADVGEDVLSRIASRNELLPRDFPRAPNPEVGEPARAPNPDAAKASCDVCDNWELGFVCDASVANGEEAGVSEKPLLAEN